MVIKFSLDVYDLLPLLYICCNFRSYNCNLVMKIVNLSKMQNFKMRCNATNHGDFITYDILKKTNKFETDIFSTITKSLHPCFI